MCLYDHDPFTYALFPCMADTSWKADQWAIIAHVLSLENPLNGDRTSNAMNNRKHQRRGSENSIPVRKALVRRDLRQLGLKKPSILQSHAAPSICSNPHGLRLFKLLTHLCMCWDMQSIARPAGAGR